MRLLKGRMLIVKLLNRDDDECGTVEVNKFKWSVFELK